VNTAKEELLRVLAQKRQSTNRPGYKNLHALAGGAYECDFVSPYSKTAGNADSDIFVFLQDLSSEEEFSGEPDQETIRLGYTSSVKTNINLIRLLSMHFNKSLADIYASNVFPFIKPGKMSAPIPLDDLIWAAAEFALPQIDIVRPRLTVVLGVAAFDAILVAAGHPYSQSLCAAIEAPFEYKGSKIWCQAHTGRGAGNRGSAAQIEKDWSTMADWYRNQGSV
jgi:hypothetical protein